MDMRSHRSRTDVLRELLSSAKLSTQEELVEALQNKGFELTQSTVSRDLKRIGAIKGTDMSGRTTYRLPGATIAPTPAQTIPSQGLKALLLDVRHNGSLIVLHTPPGSASLIAHHLDQKKPDGILGTIAGDDTIFVAPVSVTKIDKTMKAIVDSFI